MGSKDDVVLDWKSSRSDNDQHGSSFTQEWREDLLGLSETAHIEKDSLFESNNHDKADWRAELFQGLEHSAKEQDDFKDLFVRLDIELDDNCLSQDKQIGDDKDIEF